MKEIKIEIDLDTGEITLETSGFIGDECLKETEDLKKALGKATKEIRKNEFYKKINNAKQIKRRI